ncbi:MAG: hypothetical protein HC872_07095 [Gammaproteobacteria bacterium]|nr:hypothetical protein [Gammaproteobacteria bacterium]
MSAARLSSLQIFCLFLIPRLIAAIVLSNLEHIGSGGDPETYHILGLYARDLWVEPDNADLEALIDRVVDGRLVNVGGNYSLIAANVETGTWTFLNENTPIVLLHAALYLFWRNPLAFVVVSSLLGSIAYTYFAARLHINTRPTLLLYALNPVSIYFAATHYKESISESLVVALLGALAARPHYGFALVISVGIATFRSSFLPLVPFIWLMPLIGRFDARLVIIGALSVLAVAPSFFWTTATGSHGTFYSIVNMNEYTMRILGPLVGLLMPLPFVESATTPFGAFLVVYSVYYWYLLPAVLLFVLLFRRSDGTATVAILIALLLSYYVIGGVASKARFFAAFMPLLILAFTRVRVPVSVWLAPKLHALRTTDKNRDHCG